MRLDISTHKTILFQILKDTYSDTTISPFLGFKGGTAALMFYVLSYEDRAHNIKVEINRRQFGSRYEIKTYLGVSMLVMVPEDMFAHKLMAMHERIGKTSRDIYDVWLFLQHRFSINKEIVEQR